MLRSFGGRAPRVAPCAYVDVSAQVIGDADIGERSSVWMNTVIRADVNYVRIGMETNIQDLSVLHVMGNHPLIIGDRVTVGHSVTLHGCTIENDCLIGMGATVLNGALVGSGSIVAAGAVVSEGTVVPPKSLYMGVPASFKRTLGAKDLETIRAYAARYVEYRAQYIAEGGGAR